MKSKNIVLKVIDYCQNHSNQLAMIINKKPFFGKSHYLRISYGKLYDDILFSAHQLKQNGFKKGDRILVFVPMSYELYVIALSILYIGAVLVFVDAWANKNRLAMACDIVQPVGFIGTLKAQLLRLSQSIRNIPIKIISNSLISSQIVSKNDAITSEAEYVGNENEAIVTFTTGSTGAPKAAKRTHGFLLSQRNALMEHMPLQKDEVNLVTLPIFVMNNLSMGIPSYLPDFNPAKPSDFDADSMITQINELNIASSIASPAFFENIANTILKTNQLTSFKTIYTGGAPVFKPLAIKLRKAFPKTDVHVVYGATEVEPVSSIPLDDYINLDHSAGLPLGKIVNGLQLKIIQPTSEPVQIKDNESLKDYEISNNEVGEIIVSGDHVLKEYIGSSLEFNKNKIVSENQLWHRTGDAGRIDAKGFVYLHGRIKNRFYTNQNKYLFSIPIEQDLLKIDGVLFSAIFETNEKIYIALEVDPSISSSKKTHIISQVNERIKEIQVHKILFLNNIPRDPRHNSKADYEKIRLMIKK
jgi:acyl-CoA synthetase (AMP-forming)/AMP-acid ligase II